MAASLTKPFLGAPHTSTGSLQSPSLLPSPSIIQLPARRSQLKRLGLTIGSPIEVYRETSQACRPSRAYGLRSMQGGGRSLDRETAGKVADGVRAINLLKMCVGIEIKGSTIRCPNPEYAETMIAAIEAVRVRGDSIGGTVTCIVRNFPRSRGYRDFRDIAAVLAEGVMSLPATEGFEIGSGFTGTFMTGSEYIESGQSCGIQGGIIKMRIAFKPIVPISRKNTVTWDKHKMEPIAREDLDFCAVPRAVHLVEAMVAQALLPMM